MFPGNRSVDGSPQVVQALSLDQLQDRPWTIAPSNALAGAGVEEGMTWLVKTVKARKIEQKA